MVLTANPISPETEDYAADQIAANDRQQAALGQSYQQSFLVVGGTGAVSESVFQRLYDMGGFPQRIAGATRFATAVAISQETYADNAVM